MHLRGRIAYLVPALLAIMAVVVGWSQGCNAPQGVLKTTAEIRALKAVEARLGVPVELDAVVVNVEPRTRRIVVQDDAGGVVIDASTTYVPLEPGRHVRVAGITAPGDPVPIVTRPVIETLDMTTLPEAVPATVAAVGKPQFQGRLVSIEGVVRSAEIDPEGDLQMVIAAEGTPIQVRIFESTRVRYQDLIDARVRVVGTPMSVFDVRKNPFRLQIVSQRLGDVEIVDPPPGDPFSREPLSVSQVLARRPDVLGEHRILTAGRVRRISPVGTITLGMGSRMLQVNPQQMVPIQEGDSILVAGFASDGPEGTSLMHAVLRPTGEVAASEFDSLTVHRAQLTTVAQIRKLRPEQARLGHPVRLRAVVTFYVRDRYLLFVQDATGGIYVSPHGIDPFAIAPGQEVELTGITGPGHFAPTVTRPRVTVTGPGRMPEPAAYALEELFTGIGDSQWAAAEGVVQSVSRGDVGEVYLNLVNGIRRFRIQVGEEVATLPEHLIDARIRVHGVCGTIFNNSRQLIGIQILAPRMADIEVLRPGQTNPFMARARPINTLMQFDPDQEIGHRTLVRGTVTHHEAGARLFISDESGGLMVTTEHEEPLLPGDQVDVVGFVQIGDFSPVLEDAVLRRTAPGSAPAPVKVVADEIMSGRHDAELVQLEAYLLDHISTSSGQVLTLNAGQHVFTAVLDHGSSTELSDLRPGSLLQLSGVAIVMADKARLEHLPRPRGFRLILRTPADVSVVVPAPWWTSRHTISIAILALSLFLLSFGWVVVLRRRVRQQTEVIARRLEVEETLREQAQAASRAKSEFLANMSHEIRTPMNGIIGMTELAQHADSDAERSEYLDLVQHSAHSLLNLINDILDFSKIEAGKLELEQDQFPIRDHLTSVLRTVASGAHSKGLELACDVDDDVPHQLVGDANRLRQVLLNLVGNAIKFTEEGEIVVRVGCSQRTREQVRLHIEVSDTGIGIPEDKLGIIFEAFEQADTSTSRKYGGTGLGLVITQRLVSLMNGQIWVDSTVGEGSCFHIEVELGVPAGSDSGACDPGTDLLDVRVLVVDDNQTNSRILEAMLHRWGMEAASVQSGKAAIQALETAASEGRPFRLVLLDYLMPEMDGYEVAERVRRKWRSSELKIIMLTSANHTDSAALAAEYDISAHVMKPYGQTELRDAVNKTMQDHIRTTHSAPASSSTRPDLPPLDILLAEDNPINQKLVLTLLGRHGHRIDVADNGQEAVDLYRKGRYDIILMDVQMPEMNGFEATQAIREVEAGTGRRTPIIAVTARAMEGDRELCFEAGMDDYVSKPIHFDQLFEVISRVLGPQERAEAEDVDEAPGWSGDGAPGLAPAIDEGSLLSVIDGDDELLGEILSLFNSSYHRDLQQIRAAVEEADCEGVALSAHKLKGAVGNLCARGAYTMLERLETMGRADDISQAPSLLTQLADELDRVSDALYRLVEARHTPTTSQP